MRVASPGATVYLITTMIKWIRTRRLSIKNSLSLSWVEEVPRWRRAQTSATPLQRFLAYKKTRGLGVQGFGVRGYHAGGESRRLGRARIVVGQSYSHSQSLSHTRSHTHTHTPSHSHSHLHSHSLTLTLTGCRVQG